MIRRATLGDLTTLARLRGALWPHDDEASHRAELTNLLGAQADAAVAVFVGGPDPDTPAGFAEAALRRDYVNGCATSPVVFLEGVYVDPAVRGRGLARELLAAVAAWGESVGCRELASDALLHNEAGRRWHAAAGFEETERVVFFRKPLGRKAAG